MIKGKKGADKVLSIYWFVILIIVAGGIYAMVSVFYNYPDDVRTIEAELMNNKIANCFAKGGQVEDGIISLDNQTFLEKCNFNLKSEELWEEEQYYIEVSMYGVDDLNNPINYISVGNNKWPSFCEIQKEEEYGLLTRCVNKRFYAVGENKEQYLFDLTSVVRKTEKNVRQDGGFF